VKTLNVAIPVYNKIKSLKRLIFSLKRTQVPNGIKIDLHFVIDQSPHAEKLKSLINDFQWANGGKYLIEQETWKGLQRNLIACGDLSLELGHIVILEDDAFVSHWIWYFVTAILNQKVEETNAGYSLYKFGLSEGNHPFIPTTSSCFYVQKACTRGELFVDAQWREFKNWLAKESYRCKSNFLVPLSIQNFSDQSWAKLYNYYLNDTNRYFLYPPWSYSTNFGDLGAHVKRKSEENAFQVPLQMDSQLPEVPKIEETTAVYDAFFELLPSRMKGLNPNLEPYDFEVDLYGTKPFEGIEKPYVLSCKKALNPEMTFGRNLKPHELNIAYEIEGRDFFLAKKENFRENLIDKWRRELRTHYYHYPDVSITKTLKMKIFEIVNRFL
jgi:hypothetical protein